MIAETAQRAPSRDRAAQPGTIALYVALVLAVIPAVLVYVYVEPVPAMAIPIAVAALPLFARTWVSAAALRIAGLAMLAIVVVLGTASVGRLFAPAVFAMAISVAQLGGMRLGRRRATTA